VSHAADLSGVMGTLIFLMSSDAVGEINFASFRSRVSFQPGMEIHWKNKRHGKREGKKKAREKGTGRDRATVMTERITDRASCKSINSLFTHVRSLVEIFMCIFHLY
jgi:hypothetical protein